jgi:hypothetical protein
MKYMPDDINHPVTSWIELILSSPDPDCGQAGRQIRRHTILFRPFTRFIFDFKTWTPV